MLTDKQIIDKYGKPGDLSNIVTIKLPYPLRYVLNSKQWVEVNKMQCHKLVADKFLAVFKDLLAYYGLSKIQELGIDFYAGCLAVRKQRGGKDWSRHSWGIAIDLHPLKNGLKTKWKDALFSKPEYRPMIEIFYKHGFMSYGKDRNFDAMHFEINC